MGERLVANTIEGQLRDTENFCQNGIIPFNFILWREELFFSEK